MNVFKGLCRYNVNTKNQQETCLQIGNYVGLMTSFLHSNYTDNGIWHGNIKGQNS